MSFCPKCKYEYKRDSGVCPDCGETLIRSQPEPTMTGFQTASDIPPGDWVQLARLPSPEYAEMVLECLRSNDIPAVILSGTGHFGQTGQMGMSVFRPVGGQFSVMVPVAHVAEADHHGYSILGEEWEKSRTVDIG
jgi:hypothetical protein